MNLKLEIRRNSDGVIATDLWTDWTHHGDYWWEEGNASCDCNRGLFFCRALDIDGVEHQCGEGAYSVRLSDNDTGEVLYNELEKK